MAACEFYFGSHGCHREDDEPHTVHLCEWGPNEPCSEYDVNRPPHARIRQYDPDTQKWGDWQSYPEGFWWDTAQKKFVQGNLKP